MNKDKQKRLGRLNGRVVLAVKQLAELYNAGNYLIGTPNVKDWEANVANLEFRLMTLLDDRFELQQELAEEVSE